MLCWRKYYTVGAMMELCTVHAVLEESCSCSIGRYCTVGAMLKLFMWYWRRAVYAVLEDTLYSVQ